MSMTTWSSLSMLSRSATVARMAPGTLSWAMTPNQIASGAYQTRTSVCSSAGRPSTGWYCQKPVSRVARFQTGSLRTPSTRTSSASMRGIAAVGEPLPSTATPWMPAPESGALATVVCTSRRSPSTERSRMIRVNVGDARPRRNGDRGRGRTKHRNLRRGQRPGFQSGPGLRIVGGSLEMKAAPDSSRHRDHDKGDGGLVTRR